MHNIRVVLVIGLCLLWVCSAQNVTGVIRIATKQTAPFVFSDSYPTGNLKGFSVDLWDAIATQLNWKYEWVRLVTVPEVLRAVTVGSTTNVTANISIGALSITQARALVLDFSQPMFDAGLQILTYKVEEKSSNSRAQQILNAIFSRLFWEIIGIFCILSVVYAHLFYVIEKKPKGKNSSVRASYRRGGFEDSIWWAVSILFSSGSDLMPITLGGRILNMAAFITALVLISILQAAITAQLTVSTLQQTTGIQSIYDLGSLSVGVVNGSTADLYLSTFQSSGIIRYGTVEAMLAAFTGRSQLSAVFYDQPVLKYYQVTQGSKFSQLVGPVYAPQQYGIAFPTDSPLRRPVDAALLQLQETGRYQELFNKWFTGINGDGADANADTNILDPDNLTLGLTYGLVGLCALLILGIILYNLRRYRQKYPKLEDKGGDSRKETDDYTTVDQEIVEMQDTIKEFAQRLQKLRDMSHRQQKSRSIANVNLQSVSSSSSFIPENSSA